MSQRLPSSIAMCSPKGRGGARTTSSLVVCLLAIAFACATAAPPSRTVANSGGTEANAAESIDTLSYFINAHNEGLTGSHPFSQTVIGRDVYYVRWAADSYENYYYDDEYIYLKEDHNYAAEPVSHTFSNGRWMRRQMRVGESITVNSNYIQRFSIGSGGCTPTTQGIFPYTNTLLRHDPNHDFGGTIGVQDAIVLQYDYRYGSGVDYERMYYARGWGLLKWEWYRNDTLIQTSLFSEPAGVPPTRPDLSTACKGISVPQRVPSLPETLSDLVLHLYSCVLRVDVPDDEGYNFWLNDLERGAITVQGVYREFFRYSDPSIPNDEFVRRVYACVLFREIDQANLDGIIDQLVRRSLTREQLVQIVVASPEFNSGPLPRLRALQ